MKNAFLSSYFRKLKLKLLVTYLGSRICYYPMYTYGHWFTQGQGPNPLLCLWTSWTFFCWKVGWGRGEAQDDRKGGNCWILKSLWIYTGPRGMGSLFIRCLIPSQEREVERNRRNTLEIWQLDYYLMFYSTQRQGGSLWPSVSSIDHRLELSYCSETTGLFSCSIMWPQEPGPPPDVF